MGLRLYVTRNGPLIIGSCEHVNSKSATVANFIHIQGCTRNLICSTLNLVHFHSSSYPLSFPRQKPTTSTNPKGLPPNREEKLDLNSAIMMMMKEPKKIGFVMSFKLIAKLMRIYWNGLWLFRENKGTKNSSVYLSLKNLPILGLFLSSSFPILVHLRFVIKLAQLGKWIINGLIFCLKNPGNTT